jgi:hypothetical protein
LIVVVSPLGLVSFAASNTHTVRTESTTFQTGEMPEKWNSGTSGHTADAAHAVPAKRSPAAVTAFYRRAAERTARLMGKPAPKWKLCPSCKLAFHGPDTVPENPATGHTPGDWQPGSIRAPQSHRRKR